jgi:hypothetical protein
MKKITKPTSPDTISDKADKLLDRFLAKLEPKGDCLIYTGARLRNAKGEDTYGIFHVPGKGAVLAHRWAYEQFHEKPIPNGLLVRHLCNNPGCCSPTCITIGSHQDNSDDMVAAKRSTKGTKKPLKRFTDKEKTDIVQLSLSGQSTYQIAKRYQRTEPTIANVLRKHKPKPKPKPTAPQEAFANAA